MEQQSARPGKHGERRRGQCQSAAERVRAGEALVGAEQCDIPGKARVGNLTGTIADARLSGNVALLSANQGFSGSNTFSGTLTLPSAPFTVFSGPSTLLLHADTLPNF